MAGRSVESPHTRVISEWRVGPWAANTFWAYMSNEFVLINLHLLRWGGSLRQFRVILNWKNHLPCILLLTRIFPLFLSKMSTPSIFSLIFCTRISKKKRNKKQKTHNRSKPFQAGIWGGHDRGLVDEHCSPKTSSDILFCPPDHSPSLFL